MKEYIVNNDKLRNAMKKVAKQRKSNMSAILNSTDGMNDSVLSNSEQRFERADDEVKIGIEIDEFTLYGLYYEDSFNLLCDAFGISKEAFILKEIESKGKRLMNVKAAFAEIDILTKRVSELEDVVLNLMHTVEEMRKSEFKTDGKI